MDDKTRSRYEAKSAELRADLKTWENDWADTHNGSKPGREDIKRNPDIAKKYKDYNKVRDILAGKIPPPTRSASKPAKRKPEEQQQPVQTPMKKAKHTETPVKNRENDEGLMGTPAISRKLFSPTPVTALGPTPQRDGHVLGLFDLLIEKELGTPKKESGKGAEGEKGKVVSTPSKRQSTADPDSGRLGRTPMSSSKRQLLNTFMTPLKNRRGSQGAGGDGGTPSSVSKLQFDTPAFLKRHSFPAAAADENDMPAPLRLPRKPMVRGLSEIVANLRQIEEEEAEAEDDLEALREMESMEAGVMPPPSKAAPNPRVMDEEALLAADRPPQTLLLGGFDDEGAYDSDEQAQLGRDGQPLKVYKKKGQKRTTRKANMRPVRSKRAASVDLGGKEGEGEGGEEDEDAETGSEAEVLDSGAESDFDEGAAAAALAEKNKKKRAAEQQTSGEKGGKVKKAARKVNELAHANFQRLKLKNGGAKGGPGFNSRFRRRR